MKTDPLATLKTDPPGPREEWTPNTHTFRHTKAMHLLQSDIPLVTIKDFLGHADVKSTEVYVRSDLAMKRDALDRVGTPVQVGPKPRRLSKGLLAWLDSL